MLIEFERVQRPLRELRKLLKSLPENPEPEEVHRLRTRTRRVEAVAAALDPDGDRQTRRLLKVLKPVRRAAGGVRDLDVLIEDLARLRQGAKSPALDRLIGYLNRMRRRSAGRLADTVSEQRKPARRSLKKYSRMLESAASGKKPVRSEGIGEPDARGGSAADRLMDELARWPRLSAKNLHLFRLKVKKLRYVLEMDTAPDAGLMAALADVKERIGEWHDWQQLAAMANEVLDPIHDRELLERIEATGGQKLAEALAAANALRRHLRADAQSEIA